MCLGTSRLNPAYIFLAPLLRKKEVVWEENGSFSPSDW